MPARNNFYKELQDFITARPGIDMKRTIVAFESAKSTRNIKHALYYLKKTGKIKQLPNGTWAGPDTSSPVKPQEREFNSLEIGTAIADLVQHLRKENQKLKEELEECRELMSDYDRLQEDNRVLSERVTELTTMISASNAKTLKL